MSSEEKYLDQIADCCFVPETDDADSRDPVQTSEENHSIRPHWKDCINKAIVWTNMLLECYALLETLIWMYCPLLSVKNSAVFQWHDGCCKTIRLMTGSIIRIVEGNKKSETTINNASYLESSPSLLQWWLLLLSFVFQEVQHEWKAYPFVSNVNTVSIAKLSVSTKQALAMTYSLWIWPEWGCHRELLTWKQFRYFLAAPYAFQTNIWIVYCFHVKRNRNIMISITICKWPL